MLNVILIPLIAAVYLATAYIPILQLMFLQDYQLLLDTTPVFNKLIYLSTFTATFGLVLIICLYKLAKPHLQQKVNQVTTSKVITLSSYFLAIGVAASLLTLALSAFNYYGTSSLLLKPAPWSPEEIERIAVHEAGHALVREIEFPESTIKAEIISTNDINKANSWFSQPLPSGYVMGDNTSRLPTKKDLNIKIRIYLAGIAAEKIVYSQEEQYISGSDDLQKVKDLVILQCNNGLTSAGVILWDVLSEKEQSYLYKEIVTPQYDQVEKLLHNHRDTLLLIADKLQQKRSLTGEEINNIVGND
ncbi:MAG: hypothetical protein FH758_11255 [Firmicutes bacterium]|nr:hypothetical protein [Bacillota bacterium]